MPEAVVQSAGSPPSTPLVLRPTGFLRPIGDRGTLVRLGTDSLIQRAAQETADGNPAAKRTAERARRRLLSDRDTDGLQRLLDVADRIENGDELRYAIQQNLRFLGRQRQSRAVRDKRPVRPRTPWFVSLLRGIRRGAQHPRPLLASSRCRRRWDDVVRGRLRLPRGWHSGGRRSRAHRVASPSRPGELRALTIEAAVRATSSCGTGIRTPTSGSRDRRPTVRRSRNGSARL
jgi:hypothetical protein